MIGSLETSNITMTSSASSQNSYQLGVSQPTKKGEMRFEDGCRVIHFYHTWNKYVVNTILLDDEWIVYNIMKEIFETL